MTLSTVLLVDDEAGIRKVLGMALTDAGYNVQTAASGAEALQLYEDSQPSIVITDIKMPDMDGIELLQRIKAQNPETEVIMLTGHGDMELAVKSLKHEATDFVTKPINDEVLEIALKRARERIDLRRKLKAYTTNLEQLVEEKAQQLIAAERLAAVGQTVSELAHTIKNIANGLNAAIFVLEQGITAEQRSYLLEGWRMVKENVEKIRKMSMDLLDYGKFGQLQMRVCDPNQPAEEVYQLLRPEAQKRHVELTLALSPAIGPIELDPESIHCCLLNLVTNAIDACGAEPGVQGKKSVVIQSRASDRGLAYQVSDNGCGMGPDVRKQLFQNLFSTKGTYGTGIGLMMTKRIVDQHDGAIEIDSEAGKGTIVTIRLPGRSAD